MNHVASEKPNSEIWTTASPNSAAPLRKTTRKKRRPRPWGRYQHGAFNKSRDANKTASPSNGAPNVTTNVVSNEDSNPAPNAALNVAPDVTLNVASNSTVPNTAVYQEVEPLATLQSSHEVNRAPVNSNSTKPSKKETKLKTDDPRNTGKNTVPSDDTAKVIPDIKVATGERIFKGDMKELADFSKHWVSMDMESKSPAGDYYFNSYSHFAIHEEMLKDTVRTGTYKRGIMDNAHLFQDKIVLDVGSGTGILCFFSALAGAKHVYGIECSDIVDISRKIAVKNNLADRVTFIQGKAEEVELPVDHVDIIISEWMGYFLLYESMLDTVLFCRDKWLAKDGLIFPDRASLHIAAIEDAEYKEEKIGFWKSVYGLDYSCVQKCVMEDPIVDTVDEAALATSSCCILDLDLNTCQPNDLNFCSFFKCNIRRKDFLHALVAWFDVSFSACHKPLHFSTGPHSRYTHWKQTVFYLEDDIIADKGEILEGMVAVKKNGKNPRDLDIKLLYRFNGCHCRREKTQFFCLR